MAYGFAGGYSSAFYNGWHQGNPGVGWGGVAIRQGERGRLQEQSRIRTQERARGNMSANLMLQQVNQATADVRAKMTNKYKVEF